jgi:hypothetical protein
LDKYGGKLPSDTSLKNLSATRTGRVPFNKDQVDKFISQLRKTIEFAKLTESDTLRPVGNETGSGDGPRDDDEGGQQQSRTPARRPMQPGMKEDVFTLDEGAVILQYPKRLSKESFEDFEAYLQLVIRKAKRSIVQNEEDEQAE